MEWTPQIKEKHACGVAWILEPKTRGNIGKDMSAYVILMNIERPETKQGMKIETRIALVCFSFLLIRVYL